MGGRYDPETRYIPVEGRAADLRCDIAELRGRVEAVESIIERLPLEVQAALTGCLSHVERAASRLREADAALGAALRGMPVLRWAGLDRATELYRDAIREVRAAAG